MRRGEWYDDVFMKSIEFFRPLVFEYRGPLYLLDVDYVLLKKAYAKLFWQDVYPKTVQIVRQGYTTPPEQFCVSPMKRLYSIEISLPDKIKRIR